MKKKHEVHKHYAKLYFIHKHGIKVYPVSEFEKKARSGINDFFCIKNNQWYIEVNNNGVRKMYSKMIKGADINDAIWGVVNLYYKNLNEK